MKKQDNTIENLIAGGVIGPALGALLTNDKKGTVLAALAGAAIFASANAYEKALETNLPVLVKEGDAIYEVHADGRKKVIKKLPAKVKNIPDKITLK
jgi:hypothetical protein